MAFNFYTIIEPQSFDINIGVQKASSFDAFRKFIDLEQSVFTSIVEIYNKPKMKNIEKNKLIVKSYIIAATIFGIDELIPEMYLIHKNDNNKFNNVEHRIDKKNSIIKGNVNKKLIRFDLRSNNYSIKDALQTTIRNYEIQQMIQHFILSLEKGYTNVIMNMFWYFTPFIVDFLALLSQFCKIMLISSGTHPNFTIINHSICFFNIKRKSLLLEYLKTLQHMSTWDCNDIFLDIDASIRTHYYEQVHTYFENYSKSKIPMYKQYAKRRTWDTFETLCQKWYTTYLAKLISYKII